MRKYITIIFLILALSTSMGGCKSNDAGGLDLTNAEPVYQIKLRDSVGSAELIDDFQKSSYGFFSVTYPDLVYKEFTYRGEMASIDQVNGEMSLQYLAIQKDGLIDSPVQLSAVYESDSRHVSFYVQSTTLKAEAPSQNISSQRFADLTQKMATYMQNIGVIGGVVEITEMPAEGHWLIHHYSGNGTNADKEMKIDINTLGLIEYK